MHNKSLVQTSAQEELELNRIKDILFPKHKKQFKKEAQEFWDKENNTPFHQQEYQERKKKFQANNKQIDQIFLQKAQIITEGNEESQCSAPSKIKQEILKLKKDIQKMVANNPESSTPASLVETQRMYLRRINEITKKMKHQQNYIEQVFDNFIQNLPVQSTKRHQNFNNYYYTMLVLRYIWNTLEHISHKNVSFAFQSIISRGRKMREQKQVVESKLEIITLRKEKKNFFGLCSYFQRWRLISSTENMKQKAENYLQENSLELTSKFFKNILNPPYLLTLLEEYVLESSHSIEILLYSQQTHKLTKYLQTTSKPLYNSNIQTVTHRSLLYSEDDKIDMSTIKRYQFQMEDSLTKICVDRAQVLFIDDFGRDVDAGAIDCLCRHQCQVENRKKGMMGGGVFYPLINSNKECIGLIRQYYFDFNSNHHQTIRPINRNKIAEVTAIVDYCLSINSKMIEAHKQMNYLKNNYYIKFMKIIKKIQSVKQSSIFDVLFNQLGQVLPLEQTHVYEIGQTTSKIQIQQHNLKKYDLLHRFSSPKTTPHDINYLLFAINHLKNNRQQSYLFIQNRLVYLFNNKLYDLTLSPTESEHNKSIKKDESGGNSSRLIKQVKYRSVNKNRIIPTELIYKIIGKAEQVFKSKQIQIKQNQQTLLMKQEQQLKEEISTGYENYKRLIIQLLSVPTNQLKEKPLNQFITSFLTKLNQELTKKDTKLILNYYISFFNNKKKTCLKITPNQTYLSKPEITDLTNSNSNLLTIIHNNIQMYIQIQNGQSFLELLQNKFGISRKEICQIIKEFENMFFKERISGRISGCVGENDGISMDQYQKIIRQQEKIFNKHQSQMQLQIRGKSNEKSLTERLKKLKNQHQICQLTKIFHETPNTIDLSIYNFNGIENQITPIISKNIDMSQNLTTLKKQIYRFSHYNISDIEIKIITKNDSNSKIEQLQLRQILPTDIYSQFQKTSNQKCQNYIAIYHKSQKANIKKKNLEGNEEIIIFRADCVPLVEGVDFEQYPFLKDVKSHIERILQNFKRIWYQQCKRFINYNCQAKQLCQQMSATMFVSKADQIIKNVEKHSMSMINLISRKRTQTQYNIRNFIFKLNSLNEKNIFVSFNKLEKHYRKGINNRLIKYQSYNNIKILTFVLTKLFFKNFITIKKIYSQNFKIINNISYLSSKQSQKTRKVDKIKAFNKIFYHSKRTYRIDFVYPLTDIYRRNALLFIKNAKEKVKQIKIYEQTCQTKVLQGKSFSSIASYLNQFNEKYKLFIKLNQENCLSFFNQNQQTCLRTLKVEQLNEFHSFNKRYQVVFNRCQIILFYQEDTSKQYQIKDQMNKIAQNVVEMYKQILYVSAPKLLKLKHIHRKFFQNIKRMYLQKWKKTTRQHTYQEIYKQNDTIYQLEIQNKTITEKLKLQDKSIKQNIQTFKQYAQKKRKYQTKIDYYCDKMEKIQVLNSDIDKRRHVERLLERKEILRDVFILWRQKSLVLKLEEIKRNKKHLESIIKIGSKTLQRIVNNNNKNQLNDSFKCIVVVYMFNKLESQKMHRITEEKQQYLPVSQQENQSNSFRLVTFQDDQHTYRDLNEVQCIDQNPNNSLQSTFREHCISQNSQKYYISVNKLNMDKMRHQNSSLDISKEEQDMYNKGNYKLNPKTLKFLKRMGKLNQKNFNNKFS